MNVSTETSVPTYEQATSPDDTSFVSVANSAKASTAESGTQTVSLESILRPMMAKMIKDSMMVFAQVMGQKVKETILEADPQGAQHALNITNQNLSQLADVIKAQNRLVEQERAKLGEGAFINTVKTLTQSVNDLRADFKSYESRPASESEHKRTASSLEAVVAGINKVVQRQQEQQKVVEQMPMTPSTSKARLSLYDQSEFDRMIDQTKDHKGAPAVMTIEDRCQERKQPLQLKFTDENVKKEKVTPEKKMKPVNKDEQGKENLGDSTTKTTANKAKQGKDSTTKKMTAAKEDQKKRSSLYNSSK